MRADQEDRVAQARKRSPGARPDRLLGLACGASFDAQLPVVSFAQHADEHRSGRPVLLGVDQGGDGPARSTRDEDEFEPWLALRNLVVPYEAITGQEVRSWMGSARAYTRLSAFENNDLVAVASGIIELDRPEPTVLPLVPTGNRRRGLGSALLDELRRVGVPREQ